MAQIRRFVQIKESLANNPKLQEALNEIMAHYDRSFSMRYMVHELLFKNCIKYQGTAEQFNEYEEVIQKMKVIGCFAMTELGHSSYLRGIETTATFDKQHQEFIIHTFVFLSNTKYRLIVQH